MLALFVWTLSDVIGLAFCGLCVVVIGGLLLFAGIDDGLRYIRNRFRRKP